MLWRARPRRANDEIRSRADTRVAEPASHVIDLGVVSVRNAGEDTVPRDLVEDGVISS